MNLNQRSELSLLENDTVYIKNIGRNTNNFKKKKQFKLEKEDRNKFNNELSLTIKKNREIEKKKRSNDKIKNTKAEKKQKTENNKYSIEKHKKRKIDQNKIDKNESEENESEDNEIKENESHEKKIFNEIIVSIPEKDLNDYKPLKEKSLKFTNHNDDEKKINIEKLNEKLKSENTANGKLTNDKIISELINKTASKNIGQNKEKDEDFTYNFKKEVKNEKVNINVHKKIEETKNKEKIRKHVSFSKKNLSNKKNQKIEFKNDLKPEKKQNISSVSNEKKINEKNNHKLTILSGNKINLINEIQQDNGKYLGLHPNNVQNPSELKELNNIDHNINKKYILNKESISNIVKKIIFSVKNNRSEIKIDLRPDVLGNIKVHIRDENNHLKISIATETNSVKEMIEKSLIHLKNDFHNNHFDLDKVDVFVGDTFGRSDSEKRKSTDSKPFETTENYKDKDTEFIEQPKIMHRSNTVNSEIRQVDYYI